MISISGKRYAEKHEVTCSSRTKSPARHGLKSIRLLEEWDATWPGLFECRNSTMASKATVLKVGEGGFGFVWKRKKETGNREKTRKEKDIDTPCSSSMGRATTPPTTPVSPLPPTK
jgi:hypothetical protein